MAENSSIEWCSHTFNPWSGCTNCYAEINYSVKMRGVKWGPQGNRIVAAESMWKQPLKWDRLAHDAQSWASANSTRDAERPRVFCASLADVFEDWQGPMLNAKDERLCVGPHDEWLGMSAESQKMEERRELRQTESHWLSMDNVRSRLFETIRYTPNLDWLLLTKRPENVQRMICEAGIGAEWPSSFPNVWLGTSVENQPTADDRVPKLLAVDAAVHFVSYEPALAAVNFESSLGGTRWIGGQRGHTHTGDGSPGCPLTEHHHHDDRCRNGLDLIIVGGESGRGSRPFNVDWARSTVQQGKRNSVAVFVKQVGSNLEESLCKCEKCGRIDTDGNNLFCTQCHAEGMHEHTIKDPKGGDPLEWPEDCRVREFPKAVS